MIRELTRGRLPPLGCGLRVDKQGPRIQHSVLPQLDLKPETAGTSNLLGDVEFSAQTPISYLLYTSHCSWQDSLENVWHPIFPFAFPFCRHFLNGAACSPIGTGFQVENGSSSQQRCPESRYFVVVVQFLALI